MILDFLESFYQDEEKMCLKYIVISYSFGNILFLIFFWKNFDTFF